INELLARFNKMLAEDNISAEYKDLPEYTLLSHFGRDVIAEKKKICHHNCYALHAANYHTEFGECKHVGDTCVWNGIPCTFAIKKHAEEVPHKYANKILINGTKYVVAEIDELNAKLLEIDELRRQLDSKTQLLIDH